MVVEKLQLAALLSEGWKTDPKSLTKVTSTITNQKALLDKKYEILVKANTDLMAYTKQQLQACLAVSSLPKAESDVLVDIHIAEKNTTDQEEVFPCNTDISGTLSSFIHFSVDHEAVAQANRLFKISVPDSSVDVPCPPLPTPNQIPPVSIICSKFSNTDLLSSLLLAKTAGGEIQLDVSREPNSDDGDSLECNLEDETHSALPKKKKCKRK